MTKKSGMELWQWHCRNRREKILFQLVFGNAIAEIEGKKNLWEWICGNGITKIGWKKKKFVAIGLWQWHCRNRGEITKSTHILILSVIWFVTFFYGKSNLRNKPYFKYTDYARCKPKKKKKKVHRLLRARCKQKKQNVNQPITSTPHLIWFLFSPCNIFTYSSYHV